MTPEGEEAGTHPDTRWMTYRELADFLGMEEESARRRAQRERWKRRPGNDGRTRVAVPIDAKPAKGGGGDRGGDKSSDVAPIVRGDHHPDELDKLRAELARERERTASAEREREAARIQAAAAEGEGRVLRVELARERDRVATAEQEREAARVRAAAAEEQAKFLKAQRDLALSDLDAWTAGNALARAVRAFAWKRG